MSRLVDEASASLSPPEGSAAAEEDGDERTEDLRDTDADAYAKRIAWNPNESIPQSKIKSRLLLNSKPNKDVRNASDEKDNGDGENGADDGDRGASSSVVSTLRLQQQEQLKKLMSRLNLDGEFDGAGSSAQRSSFNRYFGGSRSADGEDGQEDQDEQDGDNAVDEDPQFASLSSDTSSIAQKLGQLALDSPSGGLTSGGIGVFSPSLVADLVRSVLDLKTPAAMLSQTFGAFLCAPGVCEVFVSFLTRAPLVDTTSGTPASNLEACLRHRPKQNDLPTRRAYQVMKLLTADSPVMQTFVANKLDALVPSLFGIFDPQADGSFHHFCVVLEKLLQGRAAEVLDTIFALKHLDQLIPRLVYHLHDSAVCSALAALLQANCRPPQRRKLVDLLRQANFLGISAEIITSTLSGSVSSLFTAALLKLADEFAIDPFARSLFLDGSRLKVFVESLAKCCSTADLSCYDQSESSAQVLLCLFQICQRNPLAELPAGVKPTMSALDYANQKKTVLDAYIDAVPSLCEKLRVMSEKGPELAHVVSHLKRKLGTAKSAASGASDSSTSPAQTVPFTMLRLNIIRIVAEVAASVANAKTASLNTPRAAAATGDAERLLAVIPPTTWKQLVNLLLDHRHNNVYHAVFFKLFTAALQLNQEPSLKAIFSNTKLLTRLIQHYRSESKDTGLRGFILLVLNYVRLTAAAQRSLYISNMLQNHSEWAQFLPQLMDDTLRQQKYVTSTSDILKKMGSPSSPMFYSGPAIPGIAQPSTPVAPSVSALGAPKRAAPLAAPSTPPADNGSGTNLLDLGSVFARHLGFTETAPVPQSGATAVHPPAAVTAAKTTAAGKDASSPAKKPAPAPAPAPAPVEQPSDPLGLKAKSKSKSKKKKKTPKQETTSSGAGGKDSESGEDE